MKRYLIILTLYLCAVVPMMAQYYSVNYDKRTVEAMTAAFATEAATEAYYAEQVAKIREHYQAAEVAAAGIFTSKFLDRKALTHLGLWTSLTENYYYRRIYNMVSAKIMPKIWTVAGMMLKSPQNALYWGSYLYKVCEETKTLCYQFESIVTNSTLSFKDIAQPDKCVGLEERGYPRKDGSARKGMATGTNASEGLWMASPKQTALQNARIVLVFESAYDAMAFYQLQMRKESGLDQRERQDLKAGVYISTGGNPSYGQIQGLLKAAPQATFHLGFDKDVAGKQFVANFEDIASKQSPVAPGNVPADMREFMESFDKQPKTIKELLSFNDENYSLLPHELKQLYLVYDSAKEEALEYHYSPFLCKEDKQEAADKMNKAFKDFKDALLQKLNLHEDQDLTPVKIIREEPSEGYKDFNDELLDKKQFSMTDVVETAFDENGVDLTFERQEENEETKHHGFKR